MYSVPTATNGESFQENKNMKSYKRVFVRSFMFVKELMNGIVSYLALTQKICQQMEVWCGQSIYQTSPNLLLAGTGRPVHGVLPAKGKSKK
ncbi:hypothetical protein EJB05_56897, partial [Eragrostis curvula]